MGSKPRGSKDWAPRRLRLVPGVVCIRDPHLPVHAILASHLGPGFVPIYEERESLQVVTKKTCPIISSPVPSNTRSCLNRALTNLGITISPMQTPCLESSYIRCLSVARCPSRPYPDPVPCQCRCQARPVPNAFSAVTIPILVQMRFPSYTSDFPVPETRLFALSQSVPSSQFTNKQK